MLRPMILSALVLLALARCAGAPQASPETVRRIEVDLKALDDAVGRYLAERKELPPDVGPSLVEAGFLDRVRTDPFTSGVTFGEQTTYGYYTDFDEVCGDWYVIYSAGPDGVRSFVHDPEEHRLLVRGDDEVQSSLMVE